MSSAGATAAFEQLDRRAVRYCLWRGTPRLERAFDGRSDFDILVHTADLEALRDALQEVDFKRARTAPIRTAPGLEDWLGLGGEAGPLQHLHVHQRMLVGEPRLYRFRLPWEDEVLERRRRLKGSPAWAAAAADEAALLLIRCALQVRWRDRAPGSPGLGRLIAKLDHDLGELGRETSPAEISERVRGWLGGAEGLERLPRITPSELCALGARARRALARHTSQGAGAAAVEGFRRGLSSGARKLAGRGRGPLPRATRSGPAGGRVFAVVGNDEALARTLVDRLVALFEHKLDVARAPRGGATARARSRAAAARDLGWTTFLATPPEAAAGLVAHLGGGPADAVLFLGAPGSEPEALRALPAGRLLVASPDDDPRVLMARAAALVWSQV